MIDPFLACFGSEDHLCLDLYLRFLHMRLLSHSPFACCIFLFFQTAQGMFQKRAGPDYEECDTASKRLKSNLADLFLSNDISGSRAQSAFEDAAAAGLRVFSRLAGSKHAKSKFKNASRNLKRKLLKASKWPDIFKYKVRVFDPKTQTTKQVFVPFLLIHEVLLCMTKRTSIETLSRIDGLSKPAKDHMAWVVSQMGHSKIIPLGLWGDGVPCNFDKSQSVEMLLWSLPGMQSPLRIPITCINKKFVQTHDTIDDCMKIVSWSLKALAVGVMPMVGPDGERLSGKRGKMAGQVLPQAVLAEVRADWAFYKSTFRFPQHNELNGICFRCTCTPKDIRDVSANASWRTNRLSHWGLLERILKQGHELSPLFSAPFVKSDIFAIDWLHCADHGVTKDFLGALFKHVLPKYEGTTNAQRCSSLFVDVQKFYSTRAPEDLPGKLDNLTYSMLGSPSQPPSLRSRAGEARGLVPFALELGRKHLNAQDVMEGTILACCKHLDGCYQNLSPAVFTSESLKTHSRKLCALLVALEAMADDRSKWAVKPKLHYFQELCETMDTCPSLSWCYRDEDAGGAIMQIGRRRGGSNNCWATAKNMLDKFRAKNSIPYL